MTSLWEEASLDHEAMAHEAALDYVTAELDGVMPFLLAARSDAEFGHRMALASGRLETIALEHGLDPDDVSQLARRRYALYREALMEGEDPVEEMLHPRSYGTGPEVPDSHDTGPRWEGYSEVPRGNLDYPDPSVVRPEFPGPEPMIDAQAALRAEEKRRNKAKSKKQRQKPFGGAPGPLTNNGDDERGRHKTGSLQAQGQGSNSAYTGDYLAETPPDTGTGPGSQDIGVAGPSGPPSIPAGMPGSKTGPMVPPSIGQVTSSKDPVRRQVLAVAESVRASNPWLPEEQVLRVARTTVARYFPKVADTDWTPTITNNAPPTQTGGGNGNGGGGGIGKSIEHGMGFQMGRGLIGGGEGAAGAVADVAELAAL